MILLFFLSHVYDWHERDKRPPMSVLQASVEGFVKGRWLLLLSPTLLTHTISASTC